MDKINSTVAEMPFDHLSNCHFDAFNGEVFPLFCPLTRCNCHSKCAVFREIRTKTSYKGTNEDVAFREDGYTFGRCELFKFEIGSYRA